LSRVAASLSLLSIDSKGFSMSFITAGSIGAIILPDIILNAKLINIGFKLIKKPLYYLGKDQKTKGKGG
jgi:hypothetical protein